MNSAIVVFVLLGSAGGRTAASRGKSRRRLGINEYFSSWIEDQDALAQVLDDVVPLQRRASSDGSSTARLDAETSVVDLGCWKEGWPTTLRPVSSLASGWRTVSPLSCACLCRTVHGSKWTGIVGLGYQHLYSTCSCGVTDQLQFAHAAPAHTLRGRADDACCPRYNASLGIVGTPPPSITLSAGNHARLGFHWPLTPGQLGYPSAKISCPCFNGAGKKSCEAERNMGISKALRDSLRGSSPQNQWVQKVFRVRLGAYCSRESCPAAAAAGAARGKPPLKWENFAMCPVPSGFEEDGQQCMLKRGTQPRLATIRIGGRTPTPEGEIDSIVEGEVMMTEANGVACTAQLLLQLAGSTSQSQLSLAMATLRSSELRWSAFHGNRSLMTGWPFTEDFSRAQSAAQIRASLDFICTHPNIVALDALACWRKRGAEDTPGGEDCRVREFEKEKWRSAAAVTLSTARTRQEELVVPLDTEILQTFSRGRSCPDVDGMAAELHPLLEANVAALQRLGDDNTNAEQKTGVAFIIPFRARPVELRKWLRWMIPTLLREGAPPFSVFVAELVPGEMWNKARLNNAAVREIETRFPGRFGCVIFADVDLVLQASAEDLRAGACALTCDARVPVHYSTTLIGYNEPYIMGLQPGVFCNPADGAACGPPAYHGGQSSGGVVGLTMEQFKNVNGWPNSVWGWGKEDGLLDLRIKGKYGKMTSPIEWGAMVGNEKCIWIHMQDEEISVKGAAHVQTGEVETSFDRTRMFDHGYRQIDPLYTLVATNYEELYTKFVFDLHGN